MGVQQYPHLGFKNTVSLLLRIQQSNIYPCKILIIKNFLLEPDSGTEYLN